MEILGRYDVIHVVHVDDDWNLRRLMKDPGHRRRIKMAGDDQIVLFRRQGFFHCGHKCRVGPVPDRLRSERRCQPVHRARGEFPHQVPRRQAPAPGKSDLFNQSMLLLAFFD